MTAFPLRGVKTRLECLRRVLAVLAALAVTLGPHESTPAERTLTATMLIIAMVFLAQFEALAQVQKSPYDWALIRLEYIRRDKVEDLRRFTERLHGFAQKAAQDRRVATFFEMNRHWFHAVKAGLAPLAAPDDLEELRKDFNDYYLSTYFMFYDILFVDMEGTAFYTIRKETDVFTNLLDKRSAIGPLGDALARKPRHEVFVDFYLYTPSAEPAAFFVEPVVYKGSQMGWIVLQCEVNKFNSIFMPTDELGQTGETFLVNQDGLMLTESYFKGNSTILKQHLDNRNIQPKFKDRLGHRAVVDYRGMPALSSFEVFAFLGTQWLVVAKMDKPEIVTNHFTSHRRYYGDALMQTIARRPAPGKKTAAPARPAAAIRVDMDEFLKAENQEVLETWGISTCTALVAAVPNKCSYLAHISPKDQVYDGQQTDLLSQITKKIKSFDIYPFEMQTVVFVVIAPHLESSCRIINKLVDDGFFLSQINIAYHPEATSAAVVCDYANGSIDIAWTLRGGSKRIALTGMDATFNVGEIIEKMIFPD